MRIGKRLIVSLVSLLLFVCASAQTVQSGQWPKTLLWRITGNGLSKPSYLYGTMHLEDKRLFYFGDSLYRSLEQVEGFTMEVNLREAIDSILNKTFQKSEEEFLNRDGKRDRLKDTKKKKVLVDSLFSNVKKGDKESKRQLEKMRREQVDNVMRMDMPTFVDAYLYGIAKRQRKIIGAVEDVQDQLGLLDELGNKLDTSDFLATDEKLRFTMEDMAKSYMAQDLNRIEDFSKRGMPEQLQDKMFRQRNIKMARRMDSLSHIHSFFFAVGAGHLPGDSGVINLLKRNGFTVEPVYSSNRVSPEKYAAKLEVLPWQTVTGQNNLYHVDMPEQATDFNLFGELVKMKVDIDITTMTYYMVGQTLFNRDSSKLEDAFKAMAENMGDPYPTNITTIRKDSLDGVEGVINSIYGSYKLQLWRYANVLYMVMAGNEKKQTLFSGDIDRYFKSFTINKNAIQQKQQTAWSNFTSGEKAFSVSFPGKAKQNKTYEKNSGNSDWNVIVYDCVDINAGLYYMVQIRDIKPGYFLDGDSSFFEQIKSNMARVLKDTTKNEQFLLKGFPAMRFDGHSKEGDIFYKTMAITRGNRIYMLHTFGSSGASKEDDAKQFFESFRIMDYKHPEISKQYSEDESFYSSVAYPFTKIKKDTLEEDDDTPVKKKFVSYNPNEAISYQVFVDPISPYKWYDNDSDLYSISKYQYRDSTISIRQTTNGKLKGIERLIYLHSNNNRKIVREFLNGDTLYTLLSFIPSQYINDDRHRKFFDDFTVTNEQKTTSVFENKAEKLLSAVNSKDTATFRKAKAVIDDVSFSKNNLPLLHSALLKTYLDDSIGYGVSRTIENAISRMADSSTIDFVRMNYEGTDDKIKRKLLRLLAENKTKYSYDLFKKLLIENPPAIADVYYDFTYRISDSMELAQSLYPEYLKLSGNKYLWDGVVYNTNRLLDSNKIAMNIISPYKNNFQHSADTVLKSLRKTNDEYEGGEYTDLVELLGKFNDTRSNQLLQQFQKMKNKDLKKAAVIALLKNNQTADVAEINKLAEDKSTRTDFYDELKKIKKEKSFPLKYLTQRYFAESEMYSAGTEDDDEPSSIEYKSERVINFNGSKQKFYLYKIVYGEDSDEQTSYLGVAGPYSISDNRNIKTSVSISGLYYDKTFSAESLNELFNSFIAEREKLMKEHPEWYKSSE
ncbi:MAG: TraB/GumN family protein [Chitinophagaceae bacterium]